MLTSQRDTKRPSFALLARPVGGTRAMRVNFQLLPSLGELSPTLPEATIKTHTCNFEGSRAFAVSGGSFRDAPAPSEGTLYH